ncbi:hypothetical protein RHSIM_Rhsim01G0084200 [Rhododendron simsii]|uniref:Uncharacterized protein n=1 Tax=Rhododendron simsii TaxID=118357 RepID=A0A834HIC5_RHOSS|nr:hypothetical protein RHSIM_Rhsim01G0084200 [Rhododendron simsii]
MFLELDPVDSIAELVCTGLSSYLENNSRDGNSGDRDLELGKTEEKPKLPPVMEEKLPGEWVGSVLTAMWTTVSETLVIGAVITISSLTKNLLATSQSLLNVALSSGFYLVEDDVHC